jgi:hypothetical protein
MRITLILTQPVSKEKGKKDEAAMLEARAKKIRSSR